MAQVFGPNANSITRVVLTVAGTVAVLFAVVAYALPRSGYVGLSWVALLFVLSFADYLTR